MTTPTKPPWRPLWERVAGETGERELVEDVPDYLYPVLQKWMETALNDFEGLEESIQLRLRKGLALGYDRAGRHYVSAPGRDLLEMIDASLEANSWTFTEAKLNTTDKEARRVWANHTQMLNLRLYEAGSTWQVKEENDGLTRRVDETVAEAAKATIAAAPTDSATHLKAAWAAAYGFHPDPEKAYSQAIKAAEAAAIPATLPPTDLSPTLGKVLAHMKQASHKYSMVIDDRNGQPVFAEAVIALIDLIWWGQRDRHAGGPTSKPTTQEAAEAAVHAAILIVQWFNSKAVTKTP